MLAKSMLAIILTTLLASAAGAAEFTFERLDPTRPQTLGEAAMAGICDTGNLNPLSYAILDMITGQETFAYVFTAEPGDCPTCTEGFEVDAVHMFMRFNAEDLPLEFDVTAAFHEAVWDPQAGCWSPGPTVCGTQVTYNFLVEVPGVFDIGLPIGNAGCACATFGDVYAVTFTFPQELAVPLDGVTDEMPLGCTSYVDGGAGYVDMVPLGLPGELSMYAEVNCCEDPVPNTDRSWGDVKSLYR